MISKGINNLKLKACGFDPTNGYGHTQINKQENLEKQLQEASENKA